MAGQEGGGTEARLQLDLGSECSWPLALDGTSLFMEILLLPLWGLGSGQAPLYPGLLSTPCAEHYAGPGDEVLSEPWFWRESHWS